VQLVLRNIGGDLAGETDMATHGQPGKFTFCIAEAEKSSPWTPFHVDAGFGASDSTVTVIGASAPQNVFTYGCETGQDILEHSSARCWGSATTTSSSRRPCSS